MDSRTKMLESGDVIAGKFVVERTIGEGAVGQVVCAHHRELGTRVAIKAAHASADAARFKREARTMSTLANEHTVRVYDVGETDAGQPFMVMEYLEGRNLETVLREDENLPTLANALAWTIQACDALAEAHGRGVHHRDLKLSNIFLTKRATGEDHIRVLDFGLALGSDDGANIGAGVSGDVRAMGACLFRLLTKHEPALDVGPRIHRPEIPPTVEAIVMRCLARTPEECYAKIRDLSAALRDVKTTIERSRRSFSDFSAPSSSMKAFSKAPTSSAAAAMSFDSRPSLDRSMPSSEVSLPPPPLSQDEEALAVARRKRNILIVCGVVTAIMIVLVAIMTLRK